MRADWGMRSRVVSLIICAFLGGPAPAADANDDKLDQGLDDAAKTYPVFVRMTDQLCQRGGDYEKFCKDHQQDKRSVLRQFVVKTLHEKSVRSWDKVKEKVQALVEQGQVRYVTRYWIVNGFACEASGKACRDLAKDEAVSFVYRQRGPVPQHEKTAAKKLTDAQKEIYTKILKEWKDDSAEEFSSAGLEIPWNLKKIQVDQVWEKEKVTGRGVVVAVADSGLLIAPPLLRALWKNPREELNGKDNDGNGYTDDVFGYDFGAHSAFVLGDGEVPHGSACAGIIAGRPLKEKPLVTGVAPRARIMMLRGMGFLKAYEYALAQGADVISMSYMFVKMELGNYRGLYRTAHEHLAAGGMVAVGGAGNFATSAPRGQQICIPKDIPCVIAAAGIVEDGSQPNFSSQGPCMWHGVKFYDDFPDKAPLAKPDVTTLNGGFPCWGRPSDTKSRPRLKLLWAADDESFGLVNGMRGNSFAGPHAAGVAALMLSANPELNAWEVKDLMEATCQDLGDKGRDFSYGAGLVQALEAVRAAKQRRK